MGEGGSKLPTCESRDKGKMKNNLLVLNPDSSMDRSRRPGRVGSNSRNRSLRVHS